MSCEDVQAALAPFHVCVETEDGACVTTHCMYPSFDPVKVYVARFGDGFRVHDGGGAERSAWTHGRDDHLIKKVLARQAGRYQVKVLDGFLVVDALDRDWLLSAILAVANASASAANVIVERSVAAAESDLRDKVYSVLSSIVDERELSRSTPVIGQSGKEHEFDFVVRYPSGLLLIDTVAPHHISIAAKYVAFADVGAGAAIGQTRFAVYDRPLESDDAALMLQVADLVPFAAFRDGTMRVLGHALAH